MKVAIINYGLGNLASVSKAFNDLGATAQLAQSPADLSAADRIVLPGVGAFGDGMARLCNGGWIDALHRLTAQDRPMLGICLGMQLLADAGEEGGETAGLGLIPGRVRRLDALGCTLRVPHVGWNELSLLRSDNLFARINQREDFYFVHSFAFQPHDEGSVLAHTDYGVPVVAAVRRGNVMGTQFHPEKSSRAGRQLLRNFLDLPPC